MRAGGGIFIRKGCDELNGRHSQKTSNFDELLNRKAIDALFVFLQLLEADADGMGYRFLGMTSEHSYESQSFTELLVEGWSFGFLFHIQHYK